MPTARYPLHEEPPIPLVVGGRALLPVGPLRVYACGITPYDVTHVGHAATFVWADLLVTLAHATGAEVLMARNVTDIDDVLTDAARDRGRQFDELASTQEFEFERDMSALSVAPPRLTPRARAHVVSVIRLAAALLRAGAAYEADGYVYFRGDEVPARAGMGHGAALAASREYGDQRDAPGRKSVFDVAVWRPSEPQDPAWPSPWGWGRPGWHAECAAMALAALGTSVEVLLGGADLAFPHHAYQVAMAEAAGGAVPFAATAVHVGEVRRHGTKMAKSTGNLTLVAELLERHPAPAVRLGLLHRRWSEPWECTEAVFTDAERLRGILLEQAAQASSTTADEEREAVLARLADDLDVRGAVEVARSGGPGAAAALLTLLKLA